MRKAMLFVLCLTGCATVPQQTEQPIDYGSPPKDQDDAISQAKAMMQGQLKDPYSAQWACGNTVNHGSLGSGMMWGDKSATYHGWVLSCDVNAKNSYGAYSGVSHFEFLFQNGQLMRAAEVGLGMGATKVIFSR